MPAGLRIGLSSGSLTSLQTPSATKVLKMDYINSIEELKTINNQIVVRLTAHNRRQFTVNWNNITKAQLDTILAYCNGTRPLWVRLEDDATILYDAMSYVIADDFDTITNTGTFYYDLSIQIKQLY